MTEKEFKDTKTGEVENLVIGGYSNDWNGRCDNEFFIFTSNNLHHYSFGNALRLAAFQVDNAIIVCEAEYCKKR